MSMTPQQMQLSLKNCASAQNYCMLTANSAVPFSCLSLSSTISHGEHHHHHHSH